VDVYRFVSWCLTVIAVVTIIWPVNSALLALAYKVRQGRQPIEMEAYEFWWRCCFGALGMFGMSLVLLGLDYLMVRTAGMPAGPVQFMLLMAYIAAAIGYLFWMIAHEDLLHAASVFFLYVLLPGVPLLLIGRMTHSWEKLMQFAPWLLSPP
jgi:hypothetical protein